jgi:hypothetical protein
MAENASSVKLGVVAAIATALAGAVISWIGGWLPALWEATKAATLWTWELLTLSVPVPLAILAVLVLPFVVRAVRAIRYVAAPQPARHAGEPAEAPLSDLEERLMRLLAYADGRLVHFEDAAARLQISNLVLQQTCEALSARGYIEADNHIVRGLRIALTRAGRDFVIERGFPPGSAEQSW